MKICIAQTESSKGNVQKNIQNHLQIIEHSIELNSDLIIFPELSISNYEPDLAKGLATTKDNKIFNPFQDLSNNYDITIGIGMPTNSSSGIHISMVLFQRNKERMLYSKQMLHHDELPYFVCGNGQTYLTIKEHKIAIGICYETLQRGHFVNAIQKSADIYIASVAKPKGGVDKAYKHFSKIANDFNTPILMSNSIGFCDNFMSAGQSTVWNKDGELIGKLDQQNQGFLIYDTELGTEEIHQLRIEKGQDSDLKELFQIYLNAKNDLEKNGIHQWTENYPTKTLIKNDLKKGAVYVLKNKDEIIGAINVSEEQEAEYQSINWKFDNSKVLVIHRLVVNPKHQKKGYAQKLMDFAERFAKDNKYTSIRLDAFSKNKRVIEFYKNRTYVIRGDVYFPERKYSFHCMEKEIIITNNTMYNQPAIQPSG
jgi:predicted amidohydrolase/predicted GNAT family N-acyltransferase